MKKETAIESAQLQHLLSVNTRTIFASSILAIMVAMTEGGVLPHYWSYIWLALMLLVSVIRIAVGQYQLKHRSHNAKQIKNRLNGFRLGLSVSSMLWGTIGLLVIHYGQMEQQMFVSYILTGLSAGAVVSYSIDRMSAMSYIVFAVVPMLIGFIWVDHAISIPMAFAGFVYVGFAAYSINSFHQSLVDSVLLRRQASEREEEIKRLAFYDVLTNLPNRRLLIDRLEHALLSSQRTRNRGALLFIDLDHFKMLNDTYGHTMGDLLLKEVAGRLKQCVRQSDTVARLGGDEFIVMLEGLSDHRKDAIQEIERITEQILSRLNCPYQLGNYKYVSTPSIGVAMFGDHGSTHEELLKHADIAMYQAKKEGRNVVRMFNFDMHSDKPANAEYLM